jgi:hypothetical protein
MSNTMHVSLDTLTIQRQSGFFRALVVGFCAAVQPWVGPAGLPRVGGLNNRRHPSHLA